MTFLFFTCQWLFQFLNNFSLWNYTLHLVMQTKEASLRGSKKTMERSFVPLDDLFYLIVIEVFHIKILVQIKFLIHAVMQRKGSISIRRAKTKILNIIFWITFLQMKNSIKRYNKTPVILRHEGSLLGRQKTTERSHVPRDDFFIFYLSMTFSIFK